MSLPAFFKGGCDEKFLFFHDRDDPAKRHICLCKHGCTAQLAEFLENHGVTVLRQQEKAVYIQAEDLKMFLRPKMSESGLDRIVAEFFFGVEQAYQGSIELLKFVNMLNQKYNLGGFYMDEDGDFAFQTHLTFMDSLPWVQLEAFIRWIENSFRMVVLLHIEEFMTYLK